MSVMKDMASEEAKMDMTPMIDVVFQLIIFFMCNIKYKTLEGRLDAYLPKDVGVNTSPATKIEKVEVTVKVVEAGERRDPKNVNQPWGGKGTFEYVGRKLSYQIGPRKTADIEEVKKILTQLHREDPERKASLDMKPGTIYADMVPVLDAAMEADFTDVTFVGEFKPKKKK